MSLLFDQNLSRRLVGLLAVEYPGSEHVESAGLLEADDLFFFHYLDLRKALLTSSGPVNLPAESRAPKHLASIEYEQP